MVRINAIVGIQGYVIEFVKATEYEGKSLKGVS